MKPCKTKEIGGKKYRCFFELTLKVIGGKWKPVILYQLAREGIMRFSNLRREIQEVTERMLSKQLRELEQDGLVHREIYKQVPPKVEYSLTKLGCSLIPILISMREWGVAYEEYLGGDILFSGEEYEPRDPVAVSACYWEGKEPLPAPQRGKDTSAERRVNSSSVSKPRTVPSQ